MSAWLNKKAYNDTRYGVGNFTGNGKQNHPGQSNPRGFRFSFFIPLAMIVMSLAMLYGGHRTVTTRDEYSEVAHQSFTVVFAYITHSWSDIIAFFGINDNQFSTLVVEFIAVAVALVFALFAGIGGAFVHFFQTYAGG